MVDAYLLDTSVASAAWDGGNRHHSVIREKLAALGEDSISVCSISIGEVEYGLRVSHGPDEERYKMIRRAMLQYKIWDIDRHTAEYWAAIRGELFRSHGRPKKRGFVKERQPEDLLDRTTARELGIQENDLWIVSVAVQYDLRLITKDKKMQRILDSARTVYAYDRAEIWKLENSAT